MNQAQHMAYVAEEAGIALTNQSGDFSHHQPSLNQAKSVKAAPVLVGQSSVEYENDKTCPDIPARV